MPLFAARWHRASCRSPISPAYFAQREINGVPRKSHTFTARIGKIGGLRCVIVPPPVVKALGSATHIPVLARYGGESTLSTLAPAGGAKRRLVLQMTVLRPASLDVGDTIEVSVESTMESHKQWLPPDVTRALQSRPTAAAELDRASPSTWRMIVERLEQARTEETRQQRIERMIEHLAEMAAARAKKKRKPHQRKHPS